MNFLQTRIKIGGFVSCCLGVYTMALSSGSETSCWYWFGRILFLAIALTDLLQCPHSKVEESFQIQATHDLFYHGLRPALLFSNYDSNTNDSNNNNDDNIHNDNNATTLPYDHLQYPGVVPRTFTGPLILTSIGHIIRYILFPFVDIMNMNPLMMEIFFRFVLLIITFHGFHCMANAIDQQIGSKITSPTIGTWFLIISACQFHIPFYASRMLPNTFALVVVLHSYSFWIKSQISWAATALVIATAVFRCDVLLLLASVGLSWLIQHQLSIIEALKIGVIAGFTSLLCTIPIDSLLWQRILWPEGEVLYFNTILGKSSEWGTEPWSWYFTSALPKAMLLTILLVPLGLFTIPELCRIIEFKYLRTTNSNNNNNNANDVSSFPKDILSVLSEQLKLRSQWASFIIPIFGFIILYSFLGHKELRFLFPALPMLNLAAAVGISKLHQHAKPTKDKDGSILVRILFVGGICFVIATLLGNLVFVAVSKSNYPGGVAIDKLIRHVASNSEKYDGTQVYVHIDVAAAMSGVSLFSQRAATVLCSNNVQWSFDKGGYEEQHAVSLDEYQKFTHIISENKTVHEDFVVLDVVQGLPRLDLRNVKVQTQDTLFILQRYDQP